MTIETKKSKAYTIGGDYSFEVYGPYSWFCFDDNQNRQLIESDYSIDTPLLTVGDFRERDAMDLLAGDFDDVDDGQAVMLCELRADIVEEIRLACAEQERLYDAESDRRAVDAAVELIPDGWLVIDRCPRGFCNERDAELLDPADRDAAEESLGSHDSILTIDEYRDSLAAALAGANDPTTDPRSGVALIDDETETFSVDCDD